MKFRKFLPCSFKRQLTVTVGGIDTCPFIWIINIVEFREL